jgi:hypothetical protein
VKKICVITGTRAEYGQLRFLMQGIKESKSLQLCLIVTGTHLSKKFGLTFKDIEADGFQINHKIKILNNSDTSNSITKSMGKLLGKLADVFEEEINGFYVEKKSPISIATKLQMMSENMNKYIEISAINIKEASEKYRVETFINKLYNILNE